MESSDFCRHICCKFAAGVSSESYFENRSIFDAVGDKHTHGGLIIILCHAPCRNICASALAAVLGRLRCECCTTVCLSQVRRRCGEFLSGEYRSRLRRSVVDFVQCIVSHMILLLRLYDVVVIECRLVTEDAVITTV